MDAYRVDLLGSVSPSPSPHAVIFYTPPPPLLPSPDSTTTTAAVCVRDDSQSRDLSDTNTNANTSTNMNTNSNASRRPSLSIQPPTRSMHSRDDSSISVAGPVSSTLTLPAAEDEPNSACSNNGSNNRAPHSRPHSSGSSNGRWSTVPLDSSSLPRPAVGAEAHITPIDHPLLSPSPSPQVGNYTLTPLQQCHFAFVNSTHPAARSNVNSSGVQLYHSPSAHPRLLSLDCFRGLALLLWIVADGCGLAFTAALAPTPWDGLSLPDVCMCAMLFCTGISVGLSSSISISNGSSGNGSRSYALARLRPTLLVLRRALFLAAIGTFIDLGVTRSSHIPLHTLRILSPLLKIAVVYTVVALIHVWLPQTPAKRPPLQQMIDDAGVEEGPLQRLMRRFHSLRLLRPMFLSVAIIILLLLHSLLTLYLPPATDATTVDGRVCTSGMTTPDCAVAGAVDVQVLGREHLVSAILLQQGESGEQEQECSA